MPLGSALVDVRAPITQTQGFPQADGLSVSGRVVRDMLLFVILAVVAIDHAAAAATQFQKSNGAMVCNVACSTVGPSVPRRFIEPASNSTATIMTTRMSSLITHRARGSMMRRPRAYAADTTSKYTYRPSIVPDKWLPA